uniref:Carboxyl/cholinesterase-028a n=1 Tax=Plutella xylostella TaxID=51655 RepID=A0A1L8D6I5_PLUXY
MLKTTVFCVLVCVNVATSQSNKDLYNGQFNEYNNHPYDKSRESSRLPSPGDTDYRTYVYNNRRYGTDPGRYNPYNPSINQPGGFPYNPINTNPLDEQFKYNTNRDPNNPDALFPGILGGWREDLQGRERRDSKQLKRDIFVNTNYGQVQGFKVYLYDNPEPSSGYRPWLTPVERIQGEVSVFLGIPYAQPPVLEGRFKPPRQHPGWQLLQAVDWGPACPQPVRFTGATKGIRDMDEDCLYLNIFSPSNRSSTRPLQAVDWGPACPQPVRFTGATKGIRDMDEDCLYLNIFSPSVSILHLEIVIKIGPAPGWLLQAVDWGPACPQPVRFTGATKGIRDMDEDCLYLNIFSPSALSDIDKMHMYQHSPAIGPAPGCCKPWTEPACPQPVRFTGATKGIRDMDEDCLYLNIFSPSTEAGATAQKYAVMVYIHGGQFTSGASNLFPAHMMAAFYNVVVVSLNYRLGALGFLSTADENSPGNYGILDQAMALRWVYDNIEWFNGDRESITLFGPGAGAASAGLLAVAPQTRDIVTRIIAQSGSVLADWALIEDKYRVQNTSLVFGRLLGCPIDSSWKLLNCLRQGRSFYELGNAEFQPQVGFLPWGPVLESNFTFPGDGWYAGWRSRDWRLLDQPPVQLLQRGQFNRALQYMTGVCAQDAAYYLSWTISHHGGPLRVDNNDSLAPTYEISEQWFDQKVAELVHRYNYTLNPRGVFEAIRYMYTYHPEPHNASAVRDQYVHLLSDFLYRAPTDKLVKLLLEQNVPVYMYVLNTTVEAFRWQPWRQYAHDTERYFLTGAPFMDQQARQVALRTELVKLLLEQNVPVYMYVLNTTVEAFRWQPWRQYAHDTEKYFLTGAPFMDQHARQVALRTELVKLLLEQSVPVYMHVLNTTVEAFRWQPWRQYSHDTEKYFLTGAPFMDQARQVALRTELVQLLLEQSVPVYMYVLNTTVEAFRWQPWRQYSHDTEKYFLTGAPVMDQLVKLLLEQSVPVYMYVLNTTVEAFRWQPWRQYAHDTERYFLTGASFMDQEFFPRKQRIERQAWTGNDRNMSHFFMKAYTDFARFGNPTRSQILGLHFEMAKAGQLRYLNLNTTYNSTIQLNYRQTELAFWNIYLPTVIGRLLPTYPPITEMAKAGQLRYLNLNTTYNSTIQLNYRQTELAFWNIYLPTVIGRLLPTYPPITEYWWEPKQPLQIAFWSVSSACLVLIVLLVVCCMLWRNAKRETDRYFNSDIFMVPELDEGGIDNARSRDNIYEYRDVPMKTPATPLSRATSHPATLHSRPSSQASTGSAISLKEGVVSSSPNPRAPTPPAPRARSRTHMVQGVPQTTV